MKIEKVGDLNIMVPEDAEVQRKGKGGVISVEDTGEYVARQMEEVKGRFDKLKNEYKALRDEVAELKEEITKLRNKGLASPAR